MNDWYVYDIDGNIEASDLSRLEAADICADLSICEPESDWRYAEDVIEDGTIEEA